MEYTSPYQNFPPERWIEVTRSLIEQHPLKAPEIVEVVLSCWRAIFETRIAGKFIIGQHIFPKPQIMGFFLHELIPLELQSRYPNIWRSEIGKSDKDIVCINNNFYSIEIKTSSSSGQIYGNRSYAQDQGGEGKNKNGYYLAVNFGKFANANIPVVNLIRFGWLDHTDWVAQTAATGQQARLRPESDRAKLLTLYNSEQQALGRFF